MAQFSMEIICLTGSVPRGNQQSSDNGSQCGRILGQARQDPAKRLVGQHPPQKATDARDRGAGKQDGAGRLGNTETRRVLHAASLVNSRVATKI